MPSTVGDHFEWARSRAAEYLDQGDGGCAMASFISDLGKHRGTARLLTPEFLEQLTTALVVAGAAGVRRFIEGLPCPTSSEAEPPGAATVLP